jgi:hypothetical protein
MGFRPILDKIENILPTPTYPLPPSFPARLLDCLTDFAAALAHFLLNLSLHTFRFAFGFKVGIVGHFADLSLDPALNLPGFAFDFIFAHHSLTPFES